MRKYTTAQGDMWDGIAKKCYGTEDGMNVLILANEKHVSTVIFPAGIVLDVPDYEKKLTSVLPPWRR